MGRWTGGWTGEVDMRWIGEMDLSIGGWIGEIDMWIGGWIVGWTGGWICK